MEYPAEPPAQHGRWEEVLSGAAQRKTTVNVGSSTGASLNGNTGAADHGFRTGRALDHADQLAPPDFHDPSAAYGDMIAEQVLQGSLSESSSRVHARYSDDSAARARQRGAGIAGRSKSMYARTPLEPSRATYMPASAIKVAAGPGGHGGDLAPPQLALPLPLAGGGRGAARLGGGGPTAAGLQTRPKMGHAAEGMAPAHSSHPGSLAASQMMQPPQLNAVGGLAGMPPQRHFAGRSTEHTSPGKRGGSYQSPSIESHVRHGPIHGLRAGHAHGAVVGSAAGPAAAGGEEATRGTRSRRGSGSGTSSGSTSPARLTHHHPMRREMSASSLFGALEVQLEREQRARSRSGDRGDSQRDSRHASRALRDNGRRAGQMPALKRPASHPAMPYQSRGSAVAGAEPSRSSGVAHNARILQHQLPAPPLTYTSPGAMQLNGSSRSGGAGLEQHSHSDSPAAAASDSSQRLLEGGSRPAMQQQLLQQQTSEIGVSTPQQARAGIVVLAAQNAGQNGAVLTRGRRQDALGNRTGQTSQEPTSRGPTRHTTQNGPFVEHPQQHSPTEGGSDRSPAAFWAEIQAPQSLKAPWKLDSVAAQGRHDGSSMAESSRQSSLPPPPETLPQSAPAVAKARQSRSRSKKAPVSLRDKATALERAYWKGKLPASGSGSSGSVGDNPSGGTSRPREAPASSSDQVREPEPSVPQVEGTATGQKRRDVAQQAVSKDLDILSGLKPHGTALLEAGRASIQADQPSRLPRKPADQQQLAAGKPGGAVVAGHSSRTGKLMPAIRPTRLPPPPPLPPQLANPKRDAQQTPQAARQGASSSLATHGQSTTGTTSSMSDLVRDITSPEFDSIAAVSIPGTSTVAGRALHGSESSPNSKLAWSPSDSDVLYGLAVPLGMMQRDDDLRDPPPSGSKTGDTTGSSTQKSEAMHGVEPTGAKQQPLSRRSQLPPPPPPPRDSLQRNPVSDPLLSVGRAHAQHLGGAVPAARATARTRPRPRPRQGSDSLELPGSPRDTGLSLSKAATATWLQAQPRPRMPQITQTQGKQAAPESELMLASSQQAGAEPKTSGWDDSPPRPTQSPGRGKQSERRDSSSSSKSEVQRAWQAHRRKSMGKGQAAGRVSPGGGSIRRIPSKGGSIAGTEAGGENGHVQSTAAPPSPLLQAVLAMEGHSGAASSSSSRRSEFSRASGSSGSRSSAFHQARSVVDIDQDDNPLGIQPSGRKSTMGLSRRKSVMRPREQKHRRSAGSSPALGGDHNQSQNDLAPKQKPAQPSASAGRFHTAVEGATGTAAIEAVTGNTTGDDGGTGDGMSHRPSDVSLIDAGFIAPSPRLGPIDGSGNGGTSPPQAVPSTGGGARHPIEAGESVEDGASEEWGDLGRVERRVSRVGTELEAELELDASLGDANDDAQARKSRERGSSYSQIAAIVSQGGADNGGTPVVPAPNPTRDGHGGGASDGQAMTVPSLPQEDVPVASSPAPAGRIRLHSTASSAGGRTAGTAASLTAGTWHRHDSEGLVDEAIHQASQAKAGMPGSPNQQVDVARTPVASNESELTRPRSNPCLRPPSDGTRSPPVPLHAAWPFVPRPLLEHAKKFPQWPQLRSECKGRLVGRRGDGLVVEVDARALEDVFGIGATKPTEPGQNVPSSSARPGATGGANDARRLVLLHIPLTARPRAPVPVRRMAPRIRLAMIPQAYGKDDDETGFPEDLQDIVVKQGDGRGASAGEGAHTAAGSGSAGEGEAAIGQAEPPPAPRAPPSPASSKASSAWNGTPRRMPHSPWRPRDFVGKSSPQPNWKKWDRRLWVHWLDDSKPRGGHG